MLDSSGSRATLLKRYLIRLDGLAGLSVGMVVLLLMDRLAAFYAIPKELVLFNGVANLMYGAYSSTIASLPRRPWYLVSGLAIANMAWGVICLFGAIALVTVGSYLAAISALFEALFVGGLGWVEWRWRKEL